jgi:acyl-CoA thioester hydrolase
MPHITNLRVYFGDTDAAGVAHYSTHLLYLEKARTEWLWDAGVNVAETNNGKQHFAIRHVDIHYHRPLVLGEVLSITTTIAEIKRASVLIRHQIMKDDVVLSEADVSLVYMENGRPARLPSYLQEIYDGLRGTN